MANKRIDEFPELLELDDNDLVLVFSGSQTFAVKVATLKEVFDGGGGGGGGGAVTSVNGKTGVVVLNASDVGAGTYSKPSGGIPKSDLASAVRTSLGKADTALQTAPVTSVNGKTGAITLSPSDINAKAIQTEISSPSAIGNAIAFIDNITQNKQGVITATKKSIPYAGKNSDGLLGSSEYWDLEAASVARELMIYFGNTLPYPIIKGSVVIRKSGLYYRLYRAKIDISSESEDVESAWERLNSGTYKTGYLSEIVNRIDNHEKMIFAAYPAMSAHGDNVTIADTVAIPIRGLTIYGKSVQSSTPAPDAPVDIATVGGDGTLAVSLTDGNDTDTYNLPTSNGLPGIKDASGNCTDASSQKWLCDTIDKATGTHTQRVGVFTLDGSYTPTTISAVGNYTLFWYQVSETSIVPSTGTLCSHLPYDPSGYSQARAGFGIDASYPRNIWAKLPTSLVGSTAASIKTWMQNNHMTLVAALATPVTTDLTAEQTSTLASLMSFDGGTTVYTSGTVKPDITVAAAVTVESYVDYRLANATN